VSAVIGILAAGGSTRMRGRDKLMENVGGEPLLARQVRIARACGVPVLVALPAHDDRRAEIARAGNAKVVLVDATPPGMGESIASVAAEAERMGADGLLLLLADMPEIETDDLRAILSAAVDSPGGAVVRGASEDGRPGHPILFPRDLFPSLRRLEGDTGAREVVASAGSPRLVPLGGKRALVDLDTPEAWAAWRATRPV
jgi:CTP:molybdopterin cytidylyltransferase MocA